MKATALFRLVMAGVLLASLPAVAAAGRGPRSSAWQIEIADVDGGVQPSLALDSAGLPHVAYGGNLAGTYEYGLKYASYDGAGWQIEMVDDNVSPGWENSLAIDADDEAHIAYHDPDGALMYAHYYSGSWHIQVVDSEGDAGEHASLALDSAGRPHIAYWDYENHTIRYARRLSADWQIETVVTFTQSGYDTWLSLALDGENRPHLSYYDYDASLLKYAHHDGSAWHFETVDPEDYRGNPNSLVLDAQDRPCIAYNGDGLMLARRIGTSWQITTVDNDWGAGSSLSLAIDHLGRGHIAYSDWDYPDEQLRYAHFDGFDWQIEILDTAADTSRYEGMSLALDDSDQPHIAYQDLGPDDLKHATKAVPHICCRVYLPLVKR